MRSAGEYEKMADSTSMVNRQLLFDADGDTPVPAAEVLLGLKHGLGQIHQQNSSPTRKRKNHTHNNKSPNQKRYNTRRNKEQEIIEANEELDEILQNDSDSPIYKKRKNETLGTVQYQVKKIDTQLWKKSIRTFLRLPKALSWCRYEWFCSDIDRLFLGGQSDFSQCVKESFPGIQNNFLTAVQWRIIRRMIGKPRRCSRVFFSEERMSLAHKRKHVRDIQKKIHQGTLTSADFEHIDDIPDRIPAILTVGTKVTAYLEFNKDKGFHNGTIEALDLENNQYWIRFDQPDIGKFSVPDTDVQVNGPAEYIDLSTLRAVHSDRQHISDNHQLLYSSNAVASKLPSEIPDPLLASSPLLSRIRSTSDHHQIDEDDNTTQQQSLGGFPTDLLRQVVEMSKLLALKQERVRMISVFNKEAEKLHARHVPLMQSFQKRYATLVIDLDDINGQLNLRSEAVKKYCTELGFEDEPYHLSNSQECLQHAQEIVVSSNERLRATGSEVSSDNILSLVSKLTSLLLQIELLSQSGKSHDLSGLQKSINETINFIHVDNHKVFKKHIDTPLTLIQSGMNPSDNLHAFSVPRKPTRTSNDDNNPTLHSHAVGKS